MPRQGNGNRYSRDRDCKNTNLIVCSTKHQKGPGHLTLSIENRKDGIRGSTYKISFDRQRFLTGKMP